MKLRNLVVTALFAAVICVFSPWSLPAGPVPISLATFAVYVASATLGWKRGSLAVAIYVLLGAVGIPVFAGFTGGVNIVAGVTGGYIIGYIPCALLTGLVADKKPGRMWAYPIGMLLGTLACYALGTAWFMVQTQNTLSSALLLCVLPFLVGDAIKMIAATMLAYQLRKPLNRIMEKAEAK